MVYVLLIGFLNTIVFPAHFLISKYVKTASGGNAPYVNASLIEYIVEDYLEISDPTPDAKETDVNDIEISLEDYEFLHHNSLFISYQILKAEPVKYHTIDYQLFNSYINNSTPPPEHCL